MLPAVTAIFMNIFKSNHVILNIYAEVDRPRSLYTIILFIVTAIIFVFAITLGYAGYLTYGDQI